MVQLLRLKTLGFFFCFVFLSFLVLFATLTLARRFFLQQSCSSKASVKGSLYLSILVVYAAAECAHNSASVCSFNAYDTFFFFGISATCFPLFKYFVLVLYIQTQSSTHYWLAYVLQYKRYFVWAIITGEFFFGQ